MDVIYGGVFGTQVTNLAEGSYTLTIAAYDNTSANTLRSVNILVQPASPISITLGPPSPVAGQFQFEARGLTLGKEAVLQFAANPGSAAGWTSLQTNAVTSPVMFFSQAVQPGVRFFRVVQLP